MNDFTFYFFLVFGMIGLITTNYYIFKNGIKKSDFEKSKIDNMELQYGGVSLFYLVLGLLAFGIYLFLDRL